MTGGNWKFYQYTEIKQNTPEQPSQRRNQKGRSKNKSWMKMETSQNSWDAAKAVLSGRFIAINIYANEVERSQINNLTLHDYISWLSESYSWDARKFWCSPIVNISQYQNEINIIWPS